MQESQHETEFEFERMQRIVQDIREETPPHYSAESSCGDIVVRTSNQTMKAKFQREMMNRGFAVSHIQHRADFDDVRLVVTFSKVTDL
jgi:gamma-glutamylcysteine synthetase